MNILIPHHWLLEHLETDASPEEISDQLSLSGPSVEKIEHFEKEPVYDIEVTTNRVDAMSIRGIAREASVILNQTKGQQASLKNLDLLNKDSLQISEPALALPEVVNQPELCPRIICLVLSNIKQEPTPDWMAKRLKQIGQNIHNSAIDITNYVTHELGHPIHAFDYDRLIELGGKIIVKEAQAGQNFTTLDGESYQTVGGEVVFENPQGEIIDLPAVKGTANTSINQSTTNILLWVEKVKPSKVRWASMTHNIRTMAAQLNEKDVDPHLAKPTLLRAVQLYQELCHAQVASQIYDLFPGQEDPQPVVLTLDKIDQYLGIKMKRETVTTILEQLGCQVSLPESAEPDHNRQTELTVTPPTYRPDLTIPADIIEEVARIYGYQRLPSQLMATALPIDQDSEANFQLEQKIKEFLAAIGWQEIYSYSLISEELAKKSGWSLDSHLKLKNPLTTDKVYLRRSLLPSLAEVIAKNPQREKLAVFEIANVYQPTGEGQLPAEIIKLSLVSNQNYRQVRGDLETLLAQFYLKEIKIETTDKPSAGWVQTAQIKTDKQTLGTIGQLKTGLIGVEIDLATLTQLAKKHPNYQPLSKTMPVREDLTFTLKPTTQIGPVMETIKALDPLITQVELKTIYQQNYTFSIEYHHPQKNLETEELLPLRKSIVDQLKKEYQAKLVGAV